MTDRRGSGRNIVFWQMKCQHPGCGHPRAKHFIGRVIACSAIMYEEVPPDDVTSRGAMRRCECTGFKEVAP